MKLINNIIEFLQNLSNIFAFLSETLRKANLHEEYYVYVPSANKPQYIHKNWQSAKAEAERLKDKVTAYDNIEVLKIVYRTTGDKIPF